MTLTFVAGYLRQLLAASFACLSAFSPLQPQVRFAQLCCAFHRYCCAAQAWLLLLLLRQTARTAAACNMLRTHVPALSNLTCRSLLAL